MLGYLTFINVLLLVFNLIPAFPLDGGRIARSIAWKITGDGNRSMRFAARLGRAFSYLMVAIGVFLLVRGEVFNGVWLAVIGVFLAQAARSAEVHSEITGRIEGLRVSDVMEHSPLDPGGPPARPRRGRVLRARRPRLVPRGGRGRAARGARDPRCRRGRDGGRAAGADRGGGDGLRLGADGSGFRVGADEPFEVLLGLEGLARLGAIMAVDAEGRLRGIVTADRVRRALQPTGAAERAHRLAAQRCPDTTFSS